MTRKGRGGMPWYRAYVDSMLDGSVAHTMTNEEQMIWWKLIALARKSKCRDGTLRHGWGVPMTLGWIADTCGCSLVLLEKVLQAGMNDRNLEDDGHRIKVWEDGTIELCNFKDYNPEAQPLQPPLPPAAEDKPPLTDTKRRAIHNKFQKEHPVESELHLEAVKLGVADDFSTLQKQHRTQDRKFIRDAKERARPEQGLPPSRFSGM